MSVSEMTHVSYFFILMAVGSGTAAVILYFVFDIRRCWQIVRGRHAVVFRETEPSSVVSGIDRKGELVPQKTEVLLRPGKTAPLETMSLVQDIVMIDAR